MTDSEILTQARAAAAALDGRWYANFDELLIFAEVLTATGHLTTPMEAIDYFRKAWRFEPEHTVWERSGRPTAAGPILGALFDAAADGNTPIIPVPATTTQGMPEGGQR